MSELHAAFKSAGDKEGLEIWRIEKFEPVPVPVSQQGSFYTGDSYIVLKTTAVGKSTLAWDIHFWLGSSTSQDEAGTAAILTVQLDDNKFDGAAIQHRETQGHESKQFVAYFQPAIRYLEGGHASGFSHAITNAGTEKRLFQIKGKKNVRVRQVKPEVSSMNKGDCFILDVDHTVWVYMGDQANKMEQINANAIATKLRDQDHNGRGEIVFIDSYSSESDFNNFFTALGSGDRESVPADVSGGDDEKFERGIPEDALLFEISDSSGEMKITKLPQPLDRKQLNTKECYILDTGSSVFVWVGKQSNDKEKKAAMDRAQHYLKVHNYPSWIHVSKVPENMEPATFIENFKNWVN